MYAHQAQDHPAPPPDASPKRGITYPADAPDASVHSTPIGLKSFDDGHACVQARLVRWELSAASGRGGEPKLLQGIAFRLSTADAANAPETDRWGRRRTGETPAIGGGNRPAAATIIQAQPFVGQMIMVQHRLYGGKALSGRWAGCRFGQTANWTQMIWWPIRL